MLPAGCAVHSHSLMLCLYPAGGSWAESGPWSWSVSGRHRDQAVWHRTVVWCSVGLAIGAYPWLQSKGI